MNNYGQGTKAKENQPGLQNWNLNFTFTCSGYTKTLNSPIVTLIQLLLNDQQVTLTITRPAVQYTRKFGSLCFWETPDLPLP